MFIPVSLFVPFVNTPDNLITAISSSLPVSPSLVAALVQPLRDVVVVMPGAVKRGTNVVLQCRYDLEGDSLYSVKWYKGRREFFHYTPKEIPPVRTFPAQGVQINVSPIRTWSFSHPTPTIQDERWLWDMQRDAMRCTCGCCSWWRCGQGHL